ncbi:helicase with zinc finger domain 2 isoform X3 [Takifugu flavidus]|nr:helicase with zinc finger domain 2 isoform X3 [Takifugu flavidus]
MKCTKEEKEIGQNIEAQGLLTYRQRLLNEYRASNNDGHVFSDQIEDVSISCSEDLTVETKQVNKTLCWDFRVQTERQLVHVALLKQEPGAYFSLGEMSLDHCVYSSGECFYKGDVTYDIPVTFTTANPGLYEQWLVLDFDMRPVLLKKLRVRTGKVKLDDNEEQAVGLGSSLQSAELWHRETQDVVPCLPKTEDQEKLLKEYKRPERIRHYTSITLNSQKNVTRDNYKGQMHHFLYIEEHAEDKIVSRLNFCGEVATLDKLYSNHFGMRFCPKGQLFCVLTVPCSLRPDTPEGQALKRSIQSALVALVSSSAQDSKVYEAIILQDTKSESQMYLELSRKCCSDLSLRNTESYQMEIQFQLNRLRFCTMHKAVDLLPDMTRVLPDLEKCEVPIRSDQYVGVTALNIKQQQALSFIVGNSSDPTFVAPLLIYGPFGTGKTFTLATAAIELSKEPGNKVLICTCTNSSADLYIREHFHPFTDKKNDKLRPIRVKANTPGIAISSTDEITLKYCLLSEDGHYFLPPTKVVLDQYNIVITTTRMAFNFHSLNLPQGFFTHIFIDEASQMLECDALIPLGLAGPKTRVVLAGDHMQMGPKLFSVDDYHRSNHTLLNRLFHYYQGQKCGAAEKSRIIFNENYRSTREIVDFMSSHLYLSKNNIIQAVGNVPAPDDGRALKLHHVRGECLSDPVSLSWYNKDEVATVVEEVQHIIENWPLSWGTKDYRKVCVLSEGSQVQLIRRALSKRSLSEVNVENIANVQGKQFKAVLVSAVQTRDSLKQSHLPGVELFNDMRVLTTAMTRAQSCVVVVGDAAALCCFGKCSRVWKSYTNHCLSNNSVGPQNFTRAFFERDLLETARFQKPEHTEDDLDVTDAILQEMKAEYEQQMTDYCSDEDSVELKEFDQLARDNFSEGESDLLELGKMNPERYIQGKLFRESYNQGYVIPSKNPSRRINIKGRANLGTAFSGDVVVVEKSRVHIRREDPSARILVCTLEEEDHCKKDHSQHPFVRRTMVPVTITAPKIHILISKKRRNFIPIWKQIHGQWTVDTYQPLNEKLRLNSVFVVQVIGWKKCCYLPLGNIIDIIPVGRSLDDGLRILNEEFKIPTTSDDNFFLEDKDGLSRADLCDTLTFTIDPKHAKDLDDAISIRELEDRYELGIHIADVVSFVRQGDKLDKIAEHRGITFFGSLGKNLPMFPYKVTKDLSLLPGQVRSVVSLMFVVNKLTNEIEEKPKFQLSKIKSDRKISYEEAEEMISQRYQKTPRFDTVEDCVTIAYCFSKVQRKQRLKDWAYSKPDSNQVPGRRKANLMIEELSVMFNKFTSETLISSPKTSFCTPLRCQARPDPAKIDQFKEKKCADLIPLSFYVRNKVDVGDRTLSCVSFQIVTTVWEEIQSAARAHDIDRMVDLIAADDIHPPLQSVMDEFRRCSSKAYIISSNSSPKLKVGHYSLNVPTYTQASSPIRRYMDVVVQRLLHSVICDSHVKYTHTEISALCNKFENDIRTGNKYEQKATQICYAVILNKQSIPKLAFVLSLAPNTDHIAVTFPFNKDVFAGSLSILYRDLQLSSQPLFDEVNHCINLTWKRRIYAANVAKICRELKMWNRGPCIKLPLNMWRQVVEAVDKEELEAARSCVLSINTSQMEHSDVLLQTFSEEQDESALQLGHEVNLNLQLRAGDTLHVQLTSEIQRGYQMPTLQLVHITPHFDICIDHVHNPVACFSRSADDPSRLQYSDTEEYKRIWRPICEMESASAAVDEGDSIIIEGLEVNFRQVQRGRLTGSFFLPAAWINEWAIECYLSQCFLCIRKRGLTFNKTLIDSTPVDPKEFTWVAHGVTTIEKREDSPNPGSTVEFYVSHLPMENTPDCIFERNACFTVEIIHKLLPNIRTEQAVSIHSACELVKAIALGQRIPKEVKSAWIPMRREPPAGLPNLNTSQQEAVTEVLNNNFTLIWGPPGTGKTVVGAYIVHSLFLLNSQTQRRFVDPKDNNKKEVILYCGPSNKSVDVVAGFLLKIGTALRPLRVYGQQVEMLDYPYPDCSFQFSQRAFSQERAQSQLRSITLHHRMREEKNPFSNQIKVFDERIEAASQTKEELRRISLILKEKEALLHSEMTQHKEQDLQDIQELKHRQRALQDVKGLSTEEVKEYKRLLREARSYEFGQHDIILCTCSQSMTPVLVKTVSARQVVIDECAMTTEPQTMIPLVCNRPEKVVLIGDPKQLRPTVKNMRVKKLGMSRSLFDRYFQLHNKRVVMLDTQYRMHEDICKFPSSQFYEGKLKTGLEQPISTLRVGERVLPFVFGHVEGTTVSLVVSTAKGNENSRANKEEMETVVDIAQKLVEIAKIEQQSIAILSPYNAQVSQIRENLKNKNMKEITVTTITKSQGSEWRYVIISTVCSVTDVELESNTDGAWLSKHLGFVGDPNQINVAITRSKEGLCIIGNQKLLRLNGTWKKLLEHYMSHNAVMNAENISVQAPHR